MYICVAQSIVCEVCRTVTHAHRLLSRQHWRRLALGAGAGRRRARRGPSSELLVGRPAAGGPPAGRGSSVLAPVLDPLARRAAKRQYGGRTTYTGSPRPTPYPQPTYEMRTYSQAHDGDITRNVCESGAERRRRPRDRPATSRGDAVVRTSGPRLGPHRRSTGHLRACQDYQT